MGRCPSRSSSHLAHLSHFSATEPLPRGLHRSFRGETRARMVWGGWVGRVVRLRPSPAARRSRLHPGAADPSADVARGTDTGGFSPLGWHRAPSSSTGPSQSVASYSLVDALSTGPPVSKFSSWNSLAPFRTVMLEPGWVGRLGMDWKQRWLRSVPLVPR